MDKVLDISILRRGNFSPNEFINSDIATSEGINNGVFDAEVLANLNRTADKAQEIREFLGSSVNVSSAYRCLQLNRHPRIGSKDTSDHIKGRAIDFSASGYGSPKKVFLSLKASGIIFDQLLMEGSWLHGSIKSYGTNRNQFAYYELVDGNRFLKFI